MEKELKEFNLNNYIHVKINDLGYELMAKEHNDLMSQFKQSNDSVRTADYYKDKEDLGGYSKFQAWAFMQQFGKHIGMGFNQPFHPTIKIEFDKEPKEKTFTKKDVDRNFIGGCISGLGFASFVLGIVLLFLN